MDHITFVKPYHKIQTEYFKNGIYIRFLNKDDNLQFHNFVQIKTMGRYPQIKYKAHTNQETEEIRLKISKLRDRFTSGQIHPQSYMKKVNALRNRAILIERPFVSLNHSKDWIANWKNKRNQKDLEKNMIALLDSQVKIQLFPLKPDRQKNHSIFLLLFIDVGPVFPPQINKQKIINRPSVLEFYPSVRKFKKHFTIDDNLIIIPRRNLTHKHSQQIYLSMDTQLALLSQYMPETKFNTNLKPISNLARSKNRSEAEVTLLEPNYIFSMKSTVTNDYYLEPGNQFFVKGTQPSLSRFIFNYSFRDLMVPIQQYLKNKENLQDLNQNGIQAQGQNPDELLNRWIIIFSPINPIGFNSVNPSDFRLDLLRMDSREELFQFMLIFNTIDIVYGEKNFSAIPDLMKVFQEVAEYDKEELRKIKTIGQLQTLLARQLSNKSFISKSESVSKLYHIIRMFTMRSIMDPVDGSNIQNNNKDGLIEEASNSNLDEILPHYSFVNTNNHSPEDIVIFCFMLIFGMRKMKTIVDLEHLEDLTIVIQSREMQKIFVKDSVSSLLTKVMTLYFGINFIFLSGEEYSPLSKLPTLDLGPKSNLNQTHSLKLGSAQKYQVFTDNVSQEAVNLVRRFQEELNNFDKKIETPEEHFVPLNMTDDPMEEMN
ncbi:MAG: hypothetical protein HeimC2_27700 [Candidatus Heimdallarchaeota archaeon LC_2]|nr:MAG: hypothetical protein HeimC2_27700 [Candidatus Heimdallarchaeota archaeon LC_2]